MSLRKYNPFCFAVNLGSAQSILRHPQTYKRPVQTGWLYLFRTLHSWDATKGFFVSMPYFSRLYDESSCEGTNFHMAFLQNEFLGIWTTNKPGLGQDAVEEAVDEADFGDADPAEQSAGSNSPRTVLTPRMAAILVSPNDIPIPRWRRDDREDVPQPRRWNQNR